MLQDAETEEHSDIWERIRAGYALQDTFDDASARINTQRRWFIDRPKHVENVSKRSEPYIHYIVERLEERNMPLELALLPMIESAYNPQAFSPAKAVGLWQFMPATGLHFNLQQTHWYDGRRDITASTKAALNYLNYLHDMFDGDWLLALAAYNAGEGRVIRAIEQNRKKGLPTDYWSLSLPNETQSYVPKLLALSQIIQTPAAYAIDLAQVTNEPYFGKVVIDRQMDLSRVAQMVDLPEHEIRQLNPAYTRSVTVGGPSHLLVPTDKVEQFSTSLAQLGPQDLVDWQTYRVRPGDNLSLIASRNNLTVRALKEVNRLDNDLLKVGQVLTLPIKSGTVATTSNSRQFSSSKVRTYRVKSGDNLWQIARNHSVSVRELQRWNNLSSHTLKVGQVLTLKEAAAEDRGSITYYRVQKGDSLYVIAKRFGVDLKHIQRWNPRTGTYLQPGQTLTLYLSDS